MTDRLSNNQNARVLDSRANNFQTLACVTGDQTRDERWLYFLLTGNSRVAHPVQFVVNKGDRSIRSFSQFRNELLRIWQGRAWVGLLNSLLIFTIRQSTISIVHCIVHRPGGGGFPYLIWVWSTRLIWYVCRLWDMVFSWRFER